MKKKQTLKAMAALARHKDDGKLWAMVYHPADESGDRLIGSTLTRQGALETAQRMPKVVRWEPIDVLEFSSGETCLTRKGVVDPDNVNLSEVEYMLIFSGTPAEIMARVQKIG